MANFDYKMLKNGLRKMTNRTDPNQINNHWEVMKQIRDPQDSASQNQPRGDTPEVQDPHHHRSLLFRRQEEEEDLHGISQVLFMLWHMGICVVLIGIRRVKV